MNDKQTTNVLLMARPCDFQFNTECSSDNPFMNQSQNEQINITSQALSEYDAFIIKNTIFFFILNSCLSILRQNNIYVISFDKQNYQQLNYLKLPDQVFPNNHFSTWSNGLITVYPLRAQNRENEKLTHPFIFNLLRQANFLITDIQEIKRENAIDALESTGSIIQDRINKIAYLSISQRSSINLFNAWACKYGYQQVIFKSMDSNQTPIYHTNIIMTIATKFVIICSEVIVQEYRNLVLQSLQKYREVFLIFNKYICHKKKLTKIIEISTEQCLKYYIANSLEVHDDKGSTILIMSQTSFNHLRFDQRQRIEKYSQILTLPIEAIEKVGGGSARCMLAEIFCPKIIQ